MTSSPVIHKLPEFLANQIAAGEVVQRPESVVKELVENAIDADATHVTVIIAGAGKTLIQVIDDGAGMTEDDALLAFERHATSKLSTFDDLGRIVTFGFRGEALPSIASVANVEMKTRTRDADIATVLRMEGGTLEERGKTGAPVGTSIAVRNLFYNTPARRQFLKADTTEYRHIVETMQKFILSCPHIRITFISDGATVYDAHPADLRGRIAFLFGEKTADALVDVREETDVITVTGVLGRPSFARKSRGDQFLFVNGRAIVSRLLNHAVVSSYENMLQQGEYPMYALFLNVDPHAIDVNVHPQKLEVKFSNERGVYTVVNAVVRRTLFRHDLSPSIGFRDPGLPDDVAARTRMTSPGESGDRPQSRYDSFASMHRAPDRQPVSQRLTPDDVDTLFRSIGVEAAPQHGDDAGGPGAVVLMPSEKPVSDTQFLWQLHNKYIFTPIKSGLMIIDQHVAHERILYEKAIEALTHAAPFSQQLLFPHSFRVSPADHALLQDIADDLQRLGFVIRTGAQHMVTVEAVPQDVRVGMEEKILEEMIEQYKEYQTHGITDVRHAVAASYGCRAAIKAGERLSPPEMQILIDHLFATSNPYVCPHGRPIMIRLSLDELDRRFGRTG